MIIKKKAVEAKPASTGAKPASELATILNQKQLVKRRNKAQEQALKMRAMLWPDLDPKRLWHRNLNDGFSTMPRTLPLLMNIINDMSKSVTGGKAVPAGRTYLVLWCRVFDESLVRIDSEPVAAAEAGYTGERNVTTWREHLRVLRDLGFIDYREGPAGPHQYVLLFNPYQVVQARRSEIQSGTFTALYQRALEIGAGDELQVVAEVTESK